MIFFCKFFTNLFDISIQSNYLFNDIHLNEFVAEIKNIRKIYIESTSFFSYKKYKNFIQIS